MFIIETLAIQNSFLKEEKLIIRRASDMDKQIQQSGEVSHDALLPGRHYLSDDEKEIVMEEPHYHDERDDNFYIFQRYEVSKLASRIFSKPLYLFVTFIMVGYLYVSATSTGVIAGNSLLYIISKTIGEDLPDYYYFIIVIGFYACAIIISMNNINNLKQLSLIIMGTRFVIIIIIFFFCIKLMLENGLPSLDDIPKFNVDNITMMIGNSMFFFMSHHSMPGMVENFIPQKNLIKLLVIGYIIALTILVSFGYIALLTFSQYKVCDINQYPSAIQVISINI
jgi:hypothetical protein